MSKIEFVYFDIGNVLLLFSGGLQKLAKKHGKKYEDFLQVFLKYDDLVCRGEMTPQDLWEKYREELGIGEEDIDFVEYWTDNFILIQESFDLIDEIRKSNVKVGLLSNIYSGVYSKLVKKNFFPFVNWDTKIFSCDVGFVKPELSIYEVAQKKADTYSNKILFIDDKQDFLTPAEKSGWRVYQFNPEKINESIEGLRRLLVDNGVLT